MIVVLLGHVIMIENISKNTWLSHISLPLMGVLIFDFGNVMTKSFFQSGLCNRKYFRGNKNSVICSNHFKYGRPTAASPYPTLYLKGYNISAISSKRKPPAERTTMKEKCQKRKKLILLKCKRNQMKLGHHCWLYCWCWSDHWSHYQHYHGYTYQIILLWKSQIHPTSVNSVLNSAPIPKPLSVTMKWNTIKNNHRMVKLYTGCSSGKIFNFIVDHVRQKHRKLQYCKGAKLLTDEPKKY